MPSITLKNIPAPLYQKIKNRAKAQHRSINSEIIACLEYTAQAIRVPSEEILLQAHHIRQGIKKGISSDEIQQAIDQGRP
jgi:plasmid stability protein